MASSYLHSFELPTDGKSYLGLLAKRAYHLNTSGRFSPLPEAPPIHLAPVYERVGEQAVLRSDSDLFGFAKRTTDVVLQGSAWSHRGPTTALVVRLTLGPSSKTVRVFGDRRVVPGQREALGFESLGAFVQRPLCYRDAYGGHDTGAEALLQAQAAPELRGFGRGRESAAPASVFDPRNPLGRGYFVGEGACERALGSLAPAQEDPADPISPSRLTGADDNAWRTAPAPTSLGPVDLSMMQRAQGMLNLLRTTQPFGALFSELEGEQSPSSSAVDPTIYQCASPGLAAARLQGNERCVLVGLHPGRETLETALPGDTPAIWIEPPGVSPRPVRPELASVLLEPDQDRLTLTWCALLEVARAYPADVLEKVQHRLSWSR